MLNLRCKTRGNASPKGKPRVYFTCHPQDFEYYFQKISNDVLSLYDCAVYYTEDLSKDIEKEDLELELGQMNLFVVPVTFKLLSCPNRAMKVDVAYAKEKNIPIIPFMMESGLDALYSTPENFGKRQYLNPFSQDPTEIGYATKLSKLLNALLISEGTANRVREAFCAYVFLSYRKKDRKHVNELMKILHKSPDCQDVAVWYDEFLTPGENFDDNIKKAMQKSDVFALLVTPSILEEQDGKPNFVMGIEYPTAIDMGKKIIAAEMEPTDKNELAKKFKNVPDCVNPKKDESFNNLVLSNVKRIATAKTDNPDHNFLIGLAYLEGIDVEVDFARALNLITSSAESGLIEAMKKLCEIYLAGKCVTINLNESLKWQKRAYEQSVKVFGKDTPETLLALSDLSLSYHYCGEYEKSLECAKKAYSLGTKTLGENHPITVNAINAISMGSLRHGDCKTALKFAKKGYEIKAKFLGAEHQDTLAAINVLAMCYAYCEDYKNALKFAKKANQLSTKILGESHPDTIISLNTLASCHLRCGDFYNALKHAEKTYLLSTRVLGETHPSTLSSLSLLSLCYNACGDYKNSLNASEQAYLLNTKILGEEHPDTIVSLRSLAISHNACENYKRALTLSKKAYKLYAKTLGEEHRETLITLTFLALCYNNNENYEKALELGEKAYRLCAKVLGEEHHDTLTALGNFAAFCLDCGEYEKALNLTEKNYLLSVKVIGEERPETLTALGNLAMCYNYCENYEKSLEFNKKAYLLSTKIYNEAHPNAIIYLTNLALCYIDLEDYESALGLLEKSYFLHEQVFGKNHPQTKDVFESYIECWAKVTQ